MTKILKEVSIGALPIIVLISLLELFLVHLPLETYFRFLSSSIFVIFGVSLFLFGVNIVFVPVGGDLGSALVEKGKLGIILLSGFVIGFSVTLPEPAVQTIVMQIARIKPDLSGFAILIVTATGVGIAILLAFLTFFLRIKYKYIMSAGYGLMFILLFAAPASFRSMAIDVGTLTTGSLTVPFFMSIGIGISAVTSRTSENQSSFGILAIASLGPILAILLLGVISSWF
jgi:hypothetical protein